MGLMEQTILNGYMWRIWRHWTKVLYFGFIHFFEEKSLFPPRVVVSQSFIPPRGVVFQSFFGLYFLRSVEAFFWCAASLSEVALVASFNKGFVFFVFRWTITDNRFKCGAFETIEHRACILVFGGGIFRGYLSDAGSWSSSARMVSLNKGCVFLIFVCIQGKTVRMGACRNWTKGLYLHNDAAHQKMPQPNARNTNRNMIEKRPP